MNILAINTDGGSRINPGPSACAWVIKDKNNQIVLKGGKYLGETTSIIAEYQGLVESIKVVKNLKANRYIWTLDNLLIVEQMNKRRKVKDKTIINLYNQAQELLNQYFNNKNYSINWVERKYNKEADLMVNQILDQYETKDETTKEIEKKN